MKLYIALALILIATHVYADNGSFLAGMATTVAIHESGHLIMATAQGTTVKIKGASITYVGNMSNAEHLRLATAGFQAQWLLTETLLEINKDKKLNDYERGIIAGHIAITAAYLTVLINHPEGDIRGIKNSTGMNNLTTAAIIALPAVLDYWQVFGNNCPKWVPLLSSGSKSIGVIAVWSY